MRYQTTVFGQLLKVISRPRFERLAKKHAVGRRKRELSEWAHFVAMVFAHTGGTRSLRDMERYLERHPGAKAHLDLGAVRRSTLADANRTRSAALFEEMAKILSGQASRGRGVRETVRLIDATRIMAGRRVAQWSCEGVEEFCRYVLRAEARRTGRVLRLCVDRCGRAAAQWR